MKFVRILPLFTLVVYLTQLSTAHHFRLSANKENIEHHKQFKEKLKLIKAHEAIIKLEARRKLNPRQNEAKFPLKGIEIPGPHHALPETTPLLEKILNKYKKKENKVNKRQLKNSGSKPSVNAVNNAKGFTVNQTAFANILPKTRKGNPVI